MSEIIRYLNPATIILPRFDDDVERFLTYRDKSVEYMVHRLKQEVRYRQSDWAIARIEELKSQIKKVAMWRSPEGDALTYSGLAKDLQTRFKWDLHNDIVYPEPELIPWNKKPKFDPWPHQIGGVEAAITYRHGAICLPTGSGKSGVIRGLIKHYGLQTLIVVPSSNIARQLYNEFLENFGRNKVGLYGDGSKKFDKLITIGVAQAITRIQEGSPEWEKLSKIKVFGFDETHLIAADTFEKIAMGIAKNAPYRFFLTATLTRTDGSEQILKGLTGPMVYNKNYQDLVDQKILSPLQFKQFVVPPVITNTYSDPKKEIRSQFYSNAKLAEMAAQIINRSVEIGRPVVVLIEEFSQFAILYAKLKYPFAFAHGGAANHEALAGVPRHIHDTDSQEEIRKFNSGEVKVLIGTSAVTTGVDLKPTQCLLMMQASASEIKVKQGIGRGTRVCEGKQDCIVVDFIVRGSKVCERHAAKRREIFQEYLKQGEEVEIIGRL